jgi:hypothetical protein
MPYFALIGRDRPGSAARRAAAREEHRRYIRNPPHAVRVHVGGPLLDEGGAMDGTLLVVEAEDAETVRRFAADDPYGRADLFETVEVRGFAWGLGAP